MPTCIIKRAAGARVGSVLSDLFRSRLLGRVKLHERSASFGGLFLARTLKESACAGEVPFNETPQDVFTRRGVNY